jgi:hypothetical protein
VVLPFASTTHDVMVQVICKGSENEKRNHQIKFMPHVDERLHIFAEFDANIGQKITPNQRTYESKQAKNGKICFENPRRK